MQGSMVAGAGMLGLGRAQAQTRPAADPMVPVPMPAQAPATEGLAQLADTRLWYWDTGGDGQPVVFLHPASGSALIWGYQQPVFAKAGYRVIAYSRRGHYGSDPVPKEQPGVGSEDLNNLMDFLGVKKFHIVGSAAGVSYAMDYALSHPDRLYSFTYACGTGGIRDEHYVKMLESLRPRGFAQMPFEFQEVGPSYRAANPEGTRQWAELEHKAHSGNRAGQKPASTITLKALESLKAPTLIIAGDADLWWPPVALRMVAAHIPNCETLIVPEAGHSVYWEQPDIFNRAVLAFIARHST
jgi:pimeloyl-ACP methyl ester carboxylesterase